MPKLYLNTPLSNGGQIVTMNVYNAGFLHEEDVAINLRSGYKFELIATSKSTAIMNANTISIPKLSRRENITIIFLAEGKVFDANAIDSIESKNTTGKIVDSKDKATAFWQNFVATTLVFAFLAVPFSFGTVVGKASKIDAFQFISSKLSAKPVVQISQFKSIIEEGYSDGALENAINEKRILINVKDAKRQGNVIETTIEVKNNLDFPLLFSFKSESSAGDGSLGHDDTGYKNLAVEANKVIYIKNRSYLPTDFPVQLIENNFSFNSPEKGYVRSSQYLNFSRSP